MQLNSLPYGIPPARSRPPPVDRCVSAGSDGRHGFRPDAPAAAPVSPAAVDGDPAAALPEMRRSGRSAGALCPACWTSAELSRRALLRLLRPALRVRSGRRTRSAAAACATRPLFDRARAVLRYDEASRDLILRFKHADRIDGAPAFAGLDGAGRRRTARRGGSHRRRCRCIGARLVRRRYNQAALLANAHRRGARKAGGARSADPPPATPSQGASRPRRPAAQRRRRLRAQSRAGRQCSRARGSCWSTTC